MAKESNLKRYTIFYSQKGATGDLGYITNISAKNVTDAKIVARGAVYRQVTESKKKGAIQVNKFMNSLKFYTKK